ncbi:MAG TPA: hypothetical protein VG826_03190 [Pirellulales bacterium]|nr:hypothetical protein [Pirellulales bacterium]
MPGQQFTQKALLVAMLAVGAFLVMVAFLGGIGYERERKRREEKEVEKYRGMATLVLAYPDFPDDSPKDSGDTTALSQCHSP